MALHKKSIIKEELLEDIYASSDLSTNLPKYKFPETESAAKHIYWAIKDELMLDGNSKQNLATFCTTWVEDETKKLMLETIDKNMIDKDEYPQTAEIENRCVHMIADLWNAPDSENTLGCSTTGSSEAAMLGGLALKWKWKKKRQKEGKPIDNPNIVTGPVQVCWHKFARYWDIELREVPMEENRFTSSAEEVIKRIDENTIGVVLTLGLTFTGQYENIKAISDALDKLEKEKGLDIPIHVDAASGGFIAPFIEPELIWDFRLKRVKSINASGHKFGLAPLGVGWIIWRDEKELDEELIFKVNYLGGQMPTFALNFSRPGGQIISQYYNFLRLGKEGYKKIHQACYDIANYLANELDKLKIFKIIHRGKGGIPAVTWALKENANVNFTLYDLSDRLRTRGWLVPAYSLPKYANNIVVQRALIRHGMSKDLASLLIDDIKRAILYFKNHPITNPLTEKEAGSFNHAGRQN